MPSSSTKSAKSPTLLLLYLPQRQRGENEEESQCGLMGREKSESEQSRTHFCPNCVESATVVLTVTKGPKGDGEVATA